MDQAAEAIVTNDAACGRDRRRLIADGDRTALGETLMRATMVVVLQEVLEHPFQVSTAEDEQVVQQLPACGPHPALGKCIRPWGPVGQAEHLHSFAHKDLIEATTELGVAISEQEPGLELAGLELPGQVASLLDHPVAGGVGGDAGEVDPAGADLDEEEDVQAAEPDRVDDEEVGGEQVAGMLADELRPGPVTSLRSRRDTVPAQDSQDREVGAAVTELQELALDAPVAPALVLPGEG